jgi:hypothetical protein
MSNKTRCEHNGCRTLVDSGFCAEHQPAIINQKFQAAVDEMMQRVDRHARMRARVRALGPQEWESPEMLESPGWLTEAEWNAKNRRSAGGAS